jgi:hypothetical protein
MKQFEYLESTHSDIDKKGGLNYLGSQSWELVGFSDGHYIFKREIPQSPKPEQTRERTQSDYDGYGR